MFGGTSAGRPDFAAPVPANGYAWWYIDALSDDASQGLTIIAQIGSVFSPWYAWARKRGPAEPENHCALNVALYGRAGKRWAMTERGADALQRSPGSLRIGPSGVHWDGVTLSVHIDEVTAPLPTRLRGIIRLTPEGFGSQVVALDAAGRHRWSPIAPRARIAVEMTQPARQWFGTAYADCNWGSRPLEADFHGWHWCRAPLADGGTAVLYYTRPRDGAPRVTALRYGADGAAQAFIPPPEAVLPGSFWRLTRRIGADHRSAPSVISTLEDAPFYARSVVKTRLLGQDVVAMHEMLDLDRFDTAWMRMMLPFKAPRAVLRPAPDADDGLAP